jgi:hypothetical protein
MPVRNAPRTEGREFDAEIKDLFDTISNGLGCVRAVQAAVAIEAVGALVVYGVWLLTHMHR